MCDVVWWDWSKSYRKRNKHTKKEKAHPKTMNEDGVDGGGGGDEGGGGHGGGGGMVFDTEAYSAQLFVMQQRMEDLRTEVLAALAENKRYMQVLNTNIKRTFRPVTSSTNVSERFILLVD